MFCRSCGNELSANVVFCNGCGVKVGSNQGSQNGAGSRQMVTADVNATLRKISDYEKTSGILWMVLGGLQVISVFGIIAGVWNLYAGYTHIKISPRILASDSTIPSEFESLTPLIIFGLINLFLGGGIGIIFVIFDYIIRGKVLENRDLFTETLAGT